MKGCLTEDCPLIRAQCRRLRQCCIDSCRSSRVGPCLKTSRILQIQSCWQGSKMIFPVVNWRELDSWLLFLEKSIPLQCLSFLLSAFFEDKCSQASAEGFCLAAFSLDTHCHFLSGLESQDKYQIVWMHIGSKTLKNSQIWCWDPVNYLQFPLFQSFWETSTTSYNLQSFPC